MKHSEGQNKLSARHRKGTQKTFASFEVTGSYLSCNESWVVKRNCRVGLDS